MSRLYDMHCHLDFAENAKEAAAGAADANIHALCSTVVPSSFVAAREEFKPWPNIDVALGIHPWWVANERVSKVDVTRFEALAQETPYIGEIGLDFYGKRKESKTRQEEILLNILNCINETGDSKLVFFHAVHAAERLLDLLEECNTPEKHTCVFHWFQGTPDDFGRALSLDCWFSVGMRMLATDAGRMFAQAVPDNRLLVETDNPPHEGMPWTADMWTQELQNTLTDLAQLRNVSVEALVNTVEVNSKSALDR